VMKSGELAACLKDSSRLPTITVRQFAKFFCTLLVGRWNYDVKLMSLTSCQVTFKWL